MSKIPHLNPTPKSHTKYFLVSDSVTRKQQYNLVLLCKFCKVHRGSFLVPRSWLNSWTHQDFDKFSVLQVTLCSTLIGPKLLKDLSPFLTECTCGRTKESPDLVPWLFSFWQNISFIKGGDKSCFALNISIATWWIFLWWKVKESSFFKRSSKVDE